MKTMDISKAEKMPGVAYILTAENAPKTYPIPEELFFQGEVVAIVAAETEDQAEDAVEAIEVEYEVLPFASSLEQAMAPNAPDLSHHNGRRRNVVKTAIRMGRSRQGIFPGGYRQGVHLLFCGRDPRSDAAEWLRCQVGWRQADGLGHGPVDPPLAKHTAPGRWASRRKTFASSTNGMAARLAGRMPTGDQVLSVDGLHRETDRPAGED